jgi:uncharacterized membrane protein YbhN (UPF0104 family)
VGSVAACAWWASKQATPHFPSSAGRLALVLAALAVYVVSMTVRAWRWGLILRRAGIRYPKGEPYRLLVVGYMGNTVLPARGGELLKILLLSERSNARRTEVLGSILTDRLLDAAVVVVLFAGLTLAGTGGTPLGRTPALSGVGALAVAAVALVVYRRLRARGRLERFATAVRPVARAGRVFLEPTGAILALASATSWLLDGLVFWVVAQALQVHVNLAGALLVVVLSSVSSLIPAGPGYIGTYDAALIFGLRALNVSGGPALAQALLFRFVAFVPITLAGLVLVATHYGGLASLRRREAAAEAVAGGQPA